MWVVVLVPETSFLALAVPSLCSDESTLELWPNSRALASPFALATTPLIEAEEMLPEASPHSSSLLDVLLPKPYFSFSPKFGKNKFNTKVAPVYI